MSSFFKFFAERHTLANLIIIMTVVLGLNTLFQIKREIYPEVDLGFMVIRTLYPGASPEDVELNVTNKIEDELKNVDGLDRTTSISMENVSVVFAYIDVDAEDQDAVKAEVREAIGRVSEFPDEVTESPIIDEWKTSNIPILEVGLSGEIPYRQLRELARQFEKKLRDVPGVSRLDRYGYRAREIKVEISPQAVQTYQIPLREIIWAIQGRNIRATTGNLESYTSEKNLVTLSQFQDPYEVGDVVVRSTFEGPLVKIKKLAIVKDDFEEARILSRMNGKQAVSFVVYKNESADIVRTATAIKELAAETQKKLPADVEVLYSSDQSKYVSNRFNVVITNLLIGLVFVIIILMLFLNFRVSFWVALGIPVSLLGVIFLLPFFDRSLDSIILSSMILVIGIIVDDAIIISDNIYQRRERGEPPLQAAVEGIREVFWPVLVTVLTTFLAFAPMFFMTGNFGKFITVIPLTIGLALFISLTEAIVALPAHLLPGLRTKRKTKKRSRLWFEYLRDRYRGILCRVLRLRGIVILIFVVVLSAVGFVGSKHIKFILFPSKMATDFYIFAQMPIGSSLEATSDKVREIEELLLTLPDDELESFVTRIGENPRLNAESEHYAALSVSLTPYATRERTADEIVEALRKQTDAIEGFESISYMIESGGPPVGRPISIQIVGAYDELRKEAADSLVAFLQSIEGVKDVQRDDRLGKDQVEIKVDYDKLARLGLTVADVAQNVRIAYDGEIATSVRYGDEDVDFRVVLEEQYRRQLGYIRELPVPNRVGRLIQLGTVADLMTGPGPADYRHYKGERTTTVEADVDQSIITAVEVSDMVYAHFDPEETWPGIRFVKGGEIMETEESMTSLYATFAIAVVAIYFLLVLLFNSFSQPFTVIIAIPFGMVGVIVAFLIHGEPMSFVGMLGAIGLAGVVVNDSLVLVSHINDLRQKNPEEKVINLVGLGTSNRLRAVILTTLTTVAGLLPLAYGIGGSDPFMAATALALGYGLLFATPLTLLLVPCLYLVQYDIKRALAKIFRRSETIDEIDSPKEQKR